MTTVNNSVPDVTVVTLTIRTASGFTHELHAVRDLAKGFHFDVTTSGDKFKIEQSLIQLGIDTSESKKHLGPLVDFRKEL